MSEEELDAAVDIIAAVNAGIMESLNQGIKQKQPRTAESVVRSIVEGNAFMLNPANKPKVTGVLAKHLRLEAKETEKTYEDLIPKVERKPYPSMEAIKATIQVMGLKNPKIAALKPDDLVDVSILLKLEQSGVVR